MRSRTSETPMLWPPLTEKMICLESPERSSWKKRRPSMPRSAPFFYAFGGTGSAKAECPVLELVFVLFGELRGSGYVGGFANNLVGFADVVAEGIVEAGFDESDGQVSDVNTDPAAVELLCDLYGSSAAAEGIEDYVSFVGGGF